MVWMFPLQADIEQVADHAVDVNAIIEHDAARALDIQPQHPAGGFPLVFHVNQGDTLGSTQGTGQLPYLCNRLLLLLPGQGGVDGFSGAFAPASFFFRSHRCLPVVYKSKNGQ